MRCAGTSEQTAITCGCCCAERRKSSRRPMKARTGGFVVRVGVKNSAMPCLKRPSRTGQVRRRENPQGESSQLDLQLTKICRSSEVHAGACTSDCELPVLPPRLRQNSSYTVPTLQRESPVLVGFLILNPEDPASGARSKSNLLSQVGPVVLPRSAPRKSLGPRPMAPVS